MGRLDGKVALITGAGEGIGRASALLFADEGAAVGVLDVDGERAHAVADEVADHGGRALALAADVADARAVADAMRALVREYDSLHVLFANAGIWIEGDGPVTDLDPAAWDRTLAVNLTGTVHCCREAIPAIIRAGGGSVVITSSPVAVRPDPAYDAYTVSKAGLIALAKSIAQVYALEGVRANTILPGAVRTAMTRDAFDDPEYVRGAEQMTVLGRLGEPIEVARGALFLASDEASFVTGTSLYVDGGWMLGPQLPVRPV